MARALVCLGDKTSYGEVISASASWFENDKPIAQLSDRAWCSKCKGTFQILASAADWGEQQPYVATGDRVLCNCHDHYVFGSATQYTSTSEGILYSRNSGITEVITQVNADQHRVRFLCTDDNNQPMIDCRYTLILQNGQTEAGITDAQGYTDWNYAEASTPINLHVLTD